MNPHQPQTHCHQGTTLRPSPDVVDRGPVGDASAAYEASMDREPGEPASVITDDCCLVFVPSNECVWLDGQPVDASRTKAGDRIRLQDGRNGQVL